MSYDYGKRPRSDGGGYGMAPPAKRPMQPQEYGNRPSSYNDYPPQQQKMMNRPPPGPGMHEEKPSNVLLFTVYNPKYPITVDVIHTITSSHGTVNRIVIFRKNGVQAMVEFERIEEAERAKDGLNGADIYSGCCTLKVDWGKPTRLTVTKNDTDSWDYTNPNLGKEPPKSQPLLPDPKFQGPMYGGPGGEGPPPRRGPPMDYGYDGPGGYGGPEPMPPRDAYGPPPPRGPPRYPDERQPYDDMYGPPHQQMRGPPPGNQMRGGPPPRGPPYGGPMEYDDMMNQDGQAMLQQGSVLMVYGLNAEKMNCQRLFNLFCLYGNVVRIKFLKSKEGVAMVQMGDHASCRRCIDNLNSCFIFGNKMLLSISKQAFIQDVPNPIDLPDGTQSFTDFMGNRNNRFTTPEAAAKNRIQPASKVLYFFNAPPNVEEDAIRKIFTDLELPPPEKFRAFPSKSERSSTGLLEWNNKGDAIEAVVMANHYQLENPNGKNPYFIKLCFSGSPIKDSHY